MKNDNLLFALNCIILPCLEHPQYLKIVDEGETFPIYQISVHRDDISKVIGKGGANVNALKAMASFVGKAHGHPARITVNESRLENLPRMQGLTWSLELCLQAIKAMLRAGKLNDDGQLVPSRENQAALMLAQDPPEEFAAPLNRWLAVMGGLAGVRLMIDANATA